MQKFLQRVWFMINSTRSTQQTVGLGTENRMSHNHWTAVQKGKISLSVYKTQLYRFLQKKEKRRTVNILDVISISPRMKTREKTDGSVF